MERIIFKEDKCMKTLLANLLGLVIGFLSGGRTGSTSNDN